MILQDASMSVLIVLGEDGAESPVDEAKDNRMGERLGEARRAGRERQEDAGGEEDEENHRDEDVRIEASHLSVGT